MEKFDLLLNVLRDLQTAGMLKHFVLVGSWCQNFYRHIYGNPVEIPAARTLDADMLIPKRLPADAKGNIIEIMEKNDFAVEMDYPSGYHHFTHPDLKFEFLTDPGSKPEEEIYKFKQLGVTAQELRYMSIPLSHRMKVTYDDIALSIPEPEAFALHKIIVCCLRKKPEKAIKDTETARGMLMFFEGKPLHIKRIHEIYEEFPKGWKQRVKDGLKKAGRELPQ